MAQAGFDALLCFELVVLGVDEGFALITVNGVFANFFSRYKVVNGSIAANYGQVFIETALALLRIFHQIVDPFFLLV